MSGYFDWLIQHADILKHLGLLSLPIGVATYFVKLSLAARRERKALRIDVTTTARAYSSFATLMEDEKTKKGVLEWANTATVKYACKRFDAPAGGTLDAPTKAAVVASLRVMVPSAFALNGLVLPIHPLLSILTETEAELLVQLADYDLQFHASRERFFDALQQGLVAGSTGSASDPACQLSLEYVERVSNELTFMLKCARDFAKTAGDLFPKADKTTNQPQHSQDALDQAVVEQNKSLERYFGAQILTTYETKMPTVIHVKTEA